MDRATRTHVELARRILRLEGALRHMLEVQVDHNPADPDLMAVHKAEVDAAVVEARSVLREYW